MHISFKVGCLKRKKNHSTARPTTWPLTGCVSCNITSIENHLLSPLKRGYDPMLTKVNPIHLRMPCVKLD